MRSVAEGVGKKPGAHFMTKGTGTLWEGHTQQGVSIGVGMVHERGNSDICIV